MYTRELTHEIMRGLSQNPVVAILGPRQVGKTTLAHMIAKNMPSAYLDLENQEDFQKLGNLAEYMDLHADKLVILDEIQRYPDLFMPLRGIIDSRRREGRGNGHFLVLGSASNKLLRQSSESLAGRIQYSVLEGLNPFEIEKPDGEPLRKLWLRGGFPNSYAAPNDKASHSWRENFIRTYLERDIPQFGSQIPATALMRFWTMLAHRQGEVFNAAELARSMGSKGGTASRYLDLMDDIFLARKLPPWHGNVGKRLVKAPRVYVRDSGIVHALLQITNYEALLGHPVIGKSWEGFVIEKIISVLPSSVGYYYYRTSAGAEIDLVLQFGLEDCWAVEIKFSRTPSLTKGFHIACEDLNVKRKFVVYSGEDKFPASNDTTVLSLSHFVYTLGERIAKG